MLHVFNSALRRRIGAAGTTSLEFALILQAFLLLMLGTTDVARYLFTLQSMQTLADQAARAGTLPTSSAGYLSPQSCTALTSTTLPFSPPPFLDSSAQLCLVLGTDTASGANTVTATVTANFSAVTPGLSTLTSTTNGLTVATILKF
jgi:Flp pilus assembly protein TadG